MPSRKTPTNQPNIVRSQRRTTTPEPHSEPPQSASPSVTQPPSLFGAHNALHLQRTLGNRATERIVSRTSRQPAVQRALIQRAQGDPNKLAEADWASVAAGQTITYVPLKGGCLAVTAQFQGGGGAGVHLVMTGDSSQWTDYLAQIQGKNIATLYLDSEFLGQDSGWKVKGSWDEDFVDFTVDPSTPLKSQVKIQEEKLSEQEQQNWTSNLKCIKEWFTATTGAAQIVTSENTTPSYTL